MRKGQGSKDENRRGRRLEARWCELDGAVALVMRTGPILHAFQKEELFKGLYKGFELEQMNKGVVSLRCLFWESGRAHPAFLGKKLSHQGSETSAPEQGCTFPWAGSFLSTKINPSPLPPPWFVMLGGAVWVQSCIATQPTTWLQLNALFSASFLTTCCFSPASYSRTLTLRV